MNHFQNTLRTACAFGALAAAALFAAPAHAQYQGQTLVIASAGGVVDKAYQKATEGFEKKFGVTIKWVPGTTAGGAAKIIATKDRPEFDLGMLDDVNYLSVSQAGATMKIDPAIVTNLADLVPEARVPGNDGVPFGYNMTGFFYNKDEFAKRGWAPPKSWNDLFRPEFCHHIGFVDPGVSYFFYMMTMLSGGDVSKMDEGIAKFVKLKGCFPTLEPSAAKLEEKLQLGEYLVGIHGSVRIIPLAKAGVPVRFAVPQEGTPRSFTMAVPVAGRPNAKLIQEFMNWIISPEAEKILMEETAFIPTNSKVEIPPELKALGMPGREDIAKTVEIDRKKLVDGRRDWARKVERELAP